MGQELAQLLLSGVNIGTSIAKWGKPEKFLLNGVITITNDKLGGKRWDLLKKLNISCITFSQPEGSHLISQRIAK
jgi:hypothetical protein